MPRLKLMPMLMPNSFLVELHLDLLVLLFPLPLPQLLLMLPQLLLALPQLADNVSRRLTDSADKSQSRRPELLLFPDVCLFLTVLLFQFVFQFPELSPPLTVSLFQTVSVFQSAPRCPDSNVPPSPELFQRPCVSLSL